MDTFGKFYRIGGAPTQTFPNVKYDALEQVAGDRKCFESKHFLSPASQNFWQPYKEMMSGLNSSC